MEHLRGDSSAILAQLKTLTERMSATDQVIRESIARSAELIDRPAVARMMYKARREREKFFDPAIFGEPAWDILLDLYIAHCEDRLISVSSAGTASNMPATTGLRWIAALVDQGLIERRAAVLDRRVINVGLTDRGLIAMELFLDRYRSFLLKMGN